jgi:hypothetical protein
LGRGPAAVVSLFASAKKSWGAEGGASGPGSSVAFTTNIRAALPGLIKQYGISSMLDSSCGSIHWMPLVLKEVQQQKPDFKFMGTDVVCSLIDKHKQTYKDQPNMNFQVCMGSRLTWWRAP